jgi:hypothetical protein
MVELVLFLSEFNVIFKEHFSYISSADRKTKIKSPLNIRCPTIQHIFPDFKTLKPGLNSGVQEGLEIPAPLVAPVVLVYNFNLID